MFILVNPKFTIEKWGPKCPKLFECISMIKLNVSCISCHSRSFCTLAEHSLECYVTFLAIKCYCATSNLYIVIEPILVFDHYEVELQC